MATEPATSAAGTLTFTTAAGAHGVAALTVGAVDDGGTANGGVDTSAPQSVLVTVVNRAPTATADAPAVLENSIAGVTFDVLGNDTDPESDALTVASYDDSAISDGAVTHGAGGSFTYIPVTHFHTLVPGHELRVRVYSGSGDQAFSMAGDLPSSLTLTVP